MISKIIEATKVKSDFVPIIPFSFNHHKENEMLLFFKPEVFFNGARTADIIGMVMKKLSGAGVETSGMALLRGNFIREHEIMDRHYGFINRMSKNAGKIATAEEKEKMKSLLGIENMDEYKITGGHEFLSTFHTESMESLGKIWFSKPCVKIRSGFYALTCESEGQKVILVNGFHPSQLAFFQNPDHQIVVVLVNSNTPWGSLKNGLAGNTFPEKAGAETIRGEIFNNKEKYGAKHVTANFNFVHLSAGPFEALFEINNFLSRFPGMTLDLSQTAVAKKMHETGLTSSDVTTCIQNPAVKLNGKPSDLFSVTEEINTGEAISKYKEVI